MLTDSYPVYVLPDGVETRWATMENERGGKGAGGMSGGGRKGAACVDLKPGETRVLAEAAGTSGVVRRIWMTIYNRSPAMLRGLRLDFHWDGADKPAASAPFGDFFGVGLGRAAAFQSALFTNPEGKSFNCYIPMPFRTGMRIAITNGSGAALGALYYEIDYTLGDRIDDNALYFHAHWRREPATVMQKDYEILPAVAGKGRFLGSNIGVIANRGIYHRAWWGEGEVKIYLDGDDRYPTLCGTGTEDYIGTGWEQGRYDHLYQGCTVADSEAMQYCFYRYHIPDPVYFRQQARVTIQQLGCWDTEHKPLFLYDGNEILSTAMRPIDFSKDGGTGLYGLFERSDDWSSCAYFYLDSPVNGLPALDEAAARLGCCGQ